MKQVKFKALNMQHENVGKVIKNSKKRTIWQFEVNNRMCYLVMYYSKFSGNYSIELNKKNIYKGNKTNEQQFQFPFILENIKFEIIGNSQQYQLTIKGKPFEQYYKLDQQRKTYFLDEETNLKHLKQQKIMPQQQRMTDLQMPQQQRTTNLQMPQSEFRPRSKTADIIQKDLLTDYNPLQQDTNNTRNKNNSVFRKKKQFKPIEKNSDAEVIQQIDVSKNEDQSNMFVSRKQTLHEFQCDQDINRKYSDDFKYFEESEIKIWKNQNSSKKIDNMGVKLVHLENNTNN